MSENDAADYELRRRGLGAVCDALPTLRLPHGARRMARVYGGVGLVLVILVSFAVGAFLFALARGPIVLSWLAPVIVQSLDELYGRRYEFGLGNVVLADTRQGPALVAEGLTVKSQGRTIIAAPRAEFSVDFLGLLSGRVTPKRIEALDLELRLVMLPDGSLAISAGADPKEAVVIGPASAKPAPAGALGPDPRLLQFAGAAVRGLLDFATNPESVIGGVDHVGVAHGRLVIDDRALGRTISYSDLTLNLQRGAGGSKFELAATGASRRWSLVGTAHGAPGTRREIEARAQEFTIDELALLGGSRNQRFDTDAALSAHLHLALDAEDRIVDASGGVLAGPGYFRLDEPDHEPILIEQALGEARWDRKNRHFVFPVLKLKTKEVEFVGEGTLAPPAPLDSLAEPSTAQGDVWTGSAHLARPAKFAPERPGEEPLRIDRASLRLSFHPADKKLFIERFEVSGPQVDGTGALAFDWTNGRHLVFNLTLDNTDVVAVTRLTPTHIGGPVRVWLLEHVAAGAFKHAELHSDLSEADFVAMRYEQPAPDAAVQGEGEIVNGELINVLPDLPAIRGLSAHVRVTGRTLVVDRASGVMDTAHERRLTLSEGSFIIADNAPVPAPATLDLRFSGSVDTVSEILSLPSLARYSATPIDPAQIKGQIDGRAHLAFEVGNGARPDRVNVQLNADAANLSVERFIGAEKLESGALTIVQDHGGLRVGGTARVLGGQVQLDIRKAAGDHAQSQAQISMTLDEAARAKMGYGLPGVAGPVVATVKAPMPIGDTEAQFEIDLTKASLDNTLPGLSKPAGKPAKASFTLIKRPDGMTLDHFVLEAGATLMQGVVELGRDGAFRSAKFSQFRISAGDDVKLEASRGPDALKLVVRAVNLDARPILRSLGSAGVEHSTTGSMTKGAVSFDDVDVDLKSPLVSGFNKQILTNVELRWERRGNRLRRFALSGRFGREALVAALEPGEPAPHLELSCADAGALLSFLELYSRMESGTINANMLLAPSGRVEGELQLRDFYLKNEPAMRSLMDQGAHRYDDKGRMRYDPESVKVQRLQAQFVWTGGKLHLRDGVMSGPEMGLSFDGYVDFAHEAFDLGGSYVPFYGLNNLFSNIPLFGPIVTGGAHEGLFALNYSVVGRIDSPTINVSPLSMLTPGLFRKIFGVMDGTARGLEPPGR
ncbi:MAG: AsmA-like C-terminal region-containing protein [Methylocystis sp.]